MSEPNQLPTLEQSLNEISQLVDQMEHQEQSLEQSLAQFERGITLVKHCQKILEDAEQKVQVLIANHQKEELAPYGEINEEGSSTHEDDF